MVFFLVNYSSTFIMVIWQIGQVYDMIDSRTASQQKDFKVSARYPIERLRDPRRADVYSVPCGVVYIS
jgi:hypothetical protein